MLILGLNETINKLAMAYTVRWYGHLLRRGWSLHIAVESQRKEGRLKRTWKKQVEEESVKVGLRKENSHCQHKWSVGVNQIAAGLR